MEIVNGAHTPGPWSTKRWYYRRPGASESWFVFDAQGREMHSPGGDCGTMRSPEPYNGYGFTEADARLIAAAPELLAALENVCDFYDGPKDGGPSIGIRVQLARAAIAKARGQA